MKINPDRGVIKTGNGKETIKKKIKVFFHFKTAKAHVDYKKKRSILNKITFLFRTLNQKMVTEEILNHFTSCAISELWIFLKIMAKIY